MPPLESKMTIPVKDITLENFEALEKCAQTMQGELALRQLSEAAVWQFPEGEKIADKHSDAMWKAFHSAQQGGGFGELRSNVDTWLNDMNKGGKEVSEKVVKTFEGIQGQFKEEPIKSKEQLESFNGHLSEFKEYFSILKSFPDKEVSSKISAQLDKITKLQHEAEVAPEAIEKDTQGKKRAAKLVQKLGLKTPQEIMAQAAKSKSNVFDKIKNSLTLSGSAAISSFIKGKKQKPSKGASI